jgi:hypothetical protein
LNGSKIELHIIYHNQPARIAPAEKETRKMTTQQEKPFDEVNFIMAYEGGELDEAATVDGFQHLIDSGIVWDLQGHYGRTAAALIKAGLCHSVQAKAAS